MGLGHAKSDFSPAERQYSPNVLPPGHGNVRIPSTPRKESRVYGRESTAVQDPGLKDYRLGECLGKGAFGSVYKAFNWGTGEAVAVKQIKLTDLPKSELRMIESEIDLLKNLHHDNIVKYIGSVKSVDCLNIILEYCENGSLHSICKAYGVFPENLVGVYMTQVLQGLHYLHDQGVIHRDIKGANILTTKDGTVKLADFGVSTSILTGAQDKEAQIVGTPYWMAPEIILLSGASPASDVWSVGCTVIELLQGRPPYHNLAAMPALFAIVNDDHPPLPEGISAAARDLLMQCFQKDPNLRVTARKLLRHAWIVGCRRSDTPVFKAPANFRQAVEEVKQWNIALKSSETSLRVSTSSSDGTLSPFHPPAVPGAGFTDSYGPNHAAPKSKGLMTLANTRSNAKVYQSPELVDDDNWDKDFATAISPSALQLPHLKPQDNFGGLLSADRLKLFASTQDRPTVLSYLDDDGEADLMTIKASCQIPDSLSQLQTVRHTARTGGDAIPSALPHLETRSSGVVKEESPGILSSLRVPRLSVKSSLATNFRLPVRPDQLYREQSVEDYSDLIMDNDTVFKQGLNLTSGTPSSQHIDAPQLFHPSDLIRLPRSSQFPAIGSTRRRPHSSSPLRLLEATGPPSQSPIQIQRFAEDERDEDFSDIFGPETVGTGRSGSATSSAKLGIGTGTAHIGSEARTSLIAGNGNVFGAGSGDREEASEGRGSEDVAGLMLSSKLSVSSWLGDDEDEPDPFASMDPGWDEMDLEANIARDRHARLCEKVEVLVRSLKTTEGEEVLSKLSGELLYLLCEHSEVKNLVISAHGLLPILEILETCTVNGRHMILQLLKVVNAIILDDVVIQENLCFVGGIPIVSKFAARQYPHNIRLQAAAFVRQMYQTSTLTLQMFVSAGGLNVLVEFLDEDYDTARDLVLIGVNGIWNVFELQGPTPKNDFCRIFSRSKILYPLALVLHRVLDEDGIDEIHERIVGRIVNIFYLFSQAENYVREVIADRQVLKSVLRDLRRMKPAHQITMLKFIKNLSMLSTTIEALHSADAIDFLIDVLGFSMRKEGQPHFREISNQVLNTMFNLCRLSKERQEDAAVGGIIPLLLRIMRTERPPKEFALPILCDMAHSGSKGRRYLWQNKGLEFYVSLLADQYWQVTALDAILVWLQEETANVESHLLFCSFSEAVISCFGTNRLNAFDSNLLEPLLKLLRLSIPLAAALARPEMFAGIAQRLGHKKAVVRLNLLRLVRDIVDSCGQRETVGSGDGVRSLNRTQVGSLMQAIHTLADKDPAVLVRNLASEIVRAHGEPRQASVPITSAASSSGLASASALGSAAAPSGPSASASARRPGSNIRRRTSSYTFPSLYSSGSLPQTPAHSHARVMLRTAHSSIPSSSSSTASFIEVAVTPRRTGAVAAAQGRDQLLYRPRSRDGPTGIPRRVSGDKVAAAAAAAAKNTRLARNTSVV